jgi:hypothetical protein
MCVLRRRIHHRLRHQLHRRKTAGGRRARLLGVGKVELSAGALAEGKVCLRRRRH